MPAPDLSSGIIAAPIIPFEENGAIAWTTLDAYIAQVAAGSPRAIAMNMALSEVSSLSLDEQLEVVRRCKKTIGGHCVFLSGLNATYTAQATDIAQRLVEAGADGLVLFPPVPAFFGPLTPGMIAEYHHTIAGAVGVPLLAFQTSFVSYPTGTIKALSEIPSIVGIKDASFDVDQTLQNVAESREATRKIGVFTGSDTFILEAIMMGCDGALIGFAATATAALVQMHKHASSGKVTEAYEIWNDLAPLARIGWREPRRDYRVRMKYALLKQGVVSNCFVRAPMPPLADADRLDIDRAFADHGLANAKYHPSGHVAHAGGLRAAG